MVVRFLVMTGVLVVNDDNDDDTDDDDDDDDDLALGVDVAAVGVLCGGR